MTVVIARKDLLAGTAQPTALSVPALIVDIPDQPDDYIVEGYIDLSQMLNGDEIIVEELIAVDGQSRNPLTRATIANEQSEPILRFHSKTIRRDGKYRVQLTQIKGTVRKYPYFFIVLHFGAV